MENLSMCRICLTSDVRLCSIASHLRDMYERITSVTFQKEDRRPLVACYICHARLQNCNRLRMRSLRSEELLTEMMSSGVLKPLDLMSTNTFRVVSALHMSLGHPLQASTECHVKEEPSEIIRDTEFDQLYSEDAEYLNLEEGNIQIEENSREPEITALPSQSADNICPKIVKVVLERIDVNSSRVGCFLRSEDLKRRRQATEKTSAEATLGKLIRNKEAEAEFGEPRSTGVRVSKKFKIAALKYTEDATTNKRKIEEITNEQTKTVTIKELKIVAKKMRIEKSISASKILETCDKADINLINCDGNVNTSVDNDVCEQKSTNDTFLEQNVSSISNRKNKPFSCDTCNKCFSYKYLLKNHIFTHTGEKPYQCNDCKKGYIEKRDFKTHILTHTGEKPYQCNVCKKCFNYKNVLKTHIRTHTGDKPYQCNVCKKCFSQKGHFKSHYLTHTGEKPYRCNVCKKCFSYKNALKSHIPTHTGEKPYQCDVCKKCFSRKNDLKTHIRIHTGEKPYQCNVCKKCFTRKDHFKSHFLTHTGEKPYQCNDCKKCFGHRNVLKDHIRTHTGEKPHQCSVCNKRFIRKDDMKRHVFTHTGEKPYQCNICNKCFSDFSNYSKHIRIHNRYLKKTG